MATVKITSQIDIGLEQLFNGVSQLETVELEKFAEQVNLLLATRKMNRLPEREAELLEAINQGLPEKTQTRYDELQLKLHHEAISTAEHQELLSLIDVVEQASVDRLQYLIELAQLRQVSLDSLMNQLGIKPLPVYA
jgi:DNA-binding ferritin-like protein (Dps family)